MFEIGDPGDIKKFRSHSSTGIGIIPKLPGIGSGRRRDGYGFDRDLERLISPIPFALMLAGIDMAAAYTSARTAQW